MDNSFIGLNRLFFVPEKKIDSRCPFFVIEFVGKSLGIKFDFTLDNMRLNTDFIIESINNILAEEFMITLDEIENNLPDIALFVNPNQSTLWKSSKNLIDTFWSIYNFTPKIPLKSNESFGYKTEASPNNIDPLMVYQIAYHYKIPVSRESTLEKIQDEINNYSMKLTPLRTSILSRIKEALFSRNRKGLIDIKSYLTDSPSTASATGTCGSFPSRYPKSNTEAIMRAANEYRWDISLSVDPIREYLELDRVEDDKYSPVDPKWRKIFDINRQYFHLDFRYISDYDEMYSDIVKKGLVFRNGGSDKTNYLVLGLHPHNAELALSALDKKEIKTTINYDKIPTDHVEIYREIISSPDFICNREELYSLWNSRKCFVSPIHSATEFSSFHLNMIRINSDPNDKLRLLIEQIRKDNLECISKSKSECNVKSIKYFKKLLKIGLTIRGYKICYDELPLKESYYDLEKYQDIIEKKVIDKILKLIKKTNTFFDNIYAFTGRNILGEQKDNFKISIYGNNLTISDIFSRILDTTSVDSCIRTNSNYIIITAWYYLNYLREPLDFDIKDLKFIS